MILGENKYVLLFKLNRSYFLFFLIGINFLLHAAFLNTPPNSIHVWRQCNTLAVARNFSEENMNIFKPRVDRRGTSDGVTGMQFPIYEYLLAILYKIFGFHTWMARVFSLTVFSIGIVFVYLIFEKLFHERIIAGVAAFAFTWSAELFYDSIIALPDILALMLYVAAFYFFLRWKESKFISWLLLFLFSTMLAGLTKLQYMAVLVPVSIIVWMEIRSRKISNPSAITFFILVSAVIAVGVSWYIHAVHLIESSGLRDFGIEFRPATNIFTAVGILERNLVSDLPELLLNYSGFILFITGCYFCFTKKLTRHPLFLPLLGWGVVLFLYHIIELRQMKMHQYYMLLYIPLLLFPIAAGAKFLLMKSPALLLILLIASPVLAVIRVYPARFLKKDKGIPMELYNESIVEKLAGAVPDNRLCIAGPDESGCIFFYFLHKKGFGFESSDQLFEMENGKMNIENWINKGGTYFYTNDSLLLTNDKMKPFIKRVVMKDHSFMVAELVDGK